MKVTRLQSLIVELVTFNPDLMQQAAGCVLNSDFMCIPGPDYRLMDAGYRNTYSRVSIESFGNL